LPYLSNQAGSGSTSSVAKLISPPARSSTPSLKGKTHGCRRIFVSFIQRRADCTLTDWSSPLFRASLKTVAPAWSFLETAAN